MKILTLIRIELLKTKRSLALLMLFVTPMSVVLLSTMMFIHSDGKQVAEVGWGIFWIGNFSLWGVFMLPLYIMLITVLLNQIEHKEGGWRFMLSLPVSRVEFFLAKLLLSFIYLLVANLLLVIMIAGVTGSLTLTGYTGEGLPSPQIPLNFIFNATLAGLGILSIQQLLSWRFKNFIVPMATGVIGTFSVLQMASSKYWFLNPWSYTLVATNSSDVNRSDSGVLLSLVVFATVLVFSYFYIRQRDVTA